MSMEISSDILKICFEDTDDVCFCIQNVSTTFYWYFKSFGKMSMEISLDIFLSIEDIDDILFLFSKTSVENFINTLQIHFQNVVGNFHRHFASISKSESNLQGFQWNISSDKFTENEQFLLKRFTSG